MISQTEAPPSTEQASTEQAGTEKFRNNNRVLTPEQIEKLNTKAIRGLYRYAEQHGAYFGGGYKPEDRMGHAVIGTVRGLCDALDAAHAEISRLHDVLDQARERTKGGLNDCKVRKADHNPNGGFMATQPDEGLYQFWRGKESAYQVIDAIVGPLPVLEER
jgi:hypothetical protein